MIEKIVIKNYKKFRDLTLPLNADLNIIVGDNESGKSTLLECINLALNFKINGRFAGGELNTFLFHKPTIDDYVAKVNDGAPPAMPEILVELYLRNDPDLSRLMGSNNSLRENVPGLKVVIRFNDSFAQEYAALLSRPEDINSVPIEYYEAKWFSFADQEITARSVPLQSVVLDATSIRLQNGADSYIKSVINESLDAKQKAGLALAFRGLKESFLDLSLIHI